MKVLVTGNKGYIGSVLVQSLLDRSYEVVGYDTDYYKNNYLYPYSPDIQQIVPLRILNLLMQLFIWQPCPTTRLGNSTPT